MLSVPSCKWSRSLGGEYVDGASCIYAVFVWRIPGALGKSGDTFGYPVGDLSRDLYLPPGHCIQEPYHRHGCYGRRHLPGGSRVFVGPVCEAPGYCHGPYGCGICCASRITATESALSAGPPDLPAGLRTGGLAA